MNQLASDVSGYHFSAADKLLLDANVWLAILGPREPRSWDVRVYSGAFSRMQTAKCAIVVDVVVLSEFVNACIRIRHHMLMDSDSSVPTGYKAFRKSAFFGPVARDVADDVKRLLSFSQKVETGFSTADVYALADSFAQGHLDMSDLLIVELCRTQGLTLVTSDRDFKGVGIPILTANRQLLS